MKFSLKEKTGFYTPSPFVLIYDGRGVLFYAKREAKQGKGINFNLPSGDYQTKTPIERALKPFRFDSPRLSRPHGHKKAKLPESPLKLIYCSNPNKCSVSIKLKTIWLDHSFRDYPEPYIRFILLHELGHFLYRGKGQTSEKACDLFAGACMLKLGYNPSQIRWVINVLGHPENEKLDSKKITERKNFITKKFKI